MHAGVKQGCPLSTAPSIAKENKITYVFVQHQNQKRGEDCVLYADYVSHFRKQNELNHINKTLEQKQEVSIPAKLVVN